MNVLQNIVARRFGARQPERVLLLFPDKHLGNLLIALPALRALRDLFPQSRVCALVDEPLRPFLAGLFPPEQLIGLNYRQLESASLPVKGLSYLKIVSRLRTERFDLVVDLKGGRQSGVLARFSGAAVRIAMDRARRPELYSDLVSTVGQAVVHRVEEYLLLPQGLGSDAGAELADSLQPLPVPVGGGAELSRVAADVGLDLTAPYVVIHPGAGKEYKFWSASGFAGTADLLVARGFQVALVGTAAEAGQVDEILSLANSNPMNLSGSLGLAGLMALMAGSQLFIGNDSGPMHLAAYMARPTLAVFGPTPAERWRPLGRFGAVVQGMERCADCPPKGECPRDFDCFQRLSPQQVVAAAAELMNRVAPELPGSAMLKP